jgi:hypothetical protein
MPRSGTRWRLAPGACVLLLLLQHLCGVSRASSPSANVTIPPLKLHSYLCLTMSNYENMCVGFSAGANVTDKIGTSYYNSQLQIKRRDRNENKGQDYKTRWDVNRANGTIRSSDFGNLCVDRSAAKNSIDIILKGCGSNATFNGAHGPWNLTNFLTSVNEGGQIVTFGTAKPLCATVMACKRIQGLGSKGFVCDPNNAVVRARRPVPD